MTKFNPENWIGRKFKCSTTDEILITPSDVRVKQFFSFGECFIDVGDGVYYRAGGHYVEITGEQNGESVKMGGTI